MKIRLLLLTVFALGGFASLGQEVLPPLPPHPRLLATLAGLETLRRNAGREPGKSLAAKIVRNADALLLQEPIGHQLVANRLLYTARQIQSRIHDLGVAYWLTGNPDYAACAIRQMEIAADFPDWNDAVSFLDAAEMTAALAIGYDWFWKHLNPAQRKKIADAMIHKGLRRSFAVRHGWINSPGNWNAVCHSAMLAGALAVAELEPELAAQTLERLKKSWRKTIPATYGPGGAYSEGPGYWLYGTDYLCLGLGILQSVFGTDFELSRGAGLDRTGDFISSMIGPSWYLFNYGDGSPHTTSMFGLYFLADRFNRPDYLGGITARKLQQFVRAPGHPRPRVGNERMLPLALFYLRFTDAEIHPLPPGSYYSGATAPTQVATLRNSHGWIGIKGGSPRVSHGHMDGGSFVYDFAGLRWAYDIGNDNYEKVESAGRDLWNPAQQSDRWRLFRTGPDSHNILRIDAAIPQADGNARFTHVGAEEVHLDLSSLYRENARSVQREIKLLSDGGMTVRDRLSGLPVGAKVHWQLCTPSNPIRPDGNGLLLQQRQQRMRLDSTPVASWQIRRESDFKSQYYAGAAGITMVIAEFTVPPSGELELLFRLKPQP